MNINLFLLRYLTKYSKYDNFVQRTQEKFQVRHYRCVTLADGTVDKTPLSEQNIDRQEKRLRREYQQTYGLRWKKQKETEDLSNDRDQEESKMDLSDQQPNKNPRYEEEKEAPTSFKKREEKKSNKENDDSYGSAIHNAMMSSEEDNKEMEDSNDSGTAKEKKKRSGKAGKGRTKNKK